MNYKNTTIDYKRYLFLFCALIILFLSYTRNVFNITDSEYFVGFEKAPEGLVIGRLIKAEHQGIFSDGGLTGIAYNKDAEFLTEDDAVDAYRVRQHDIYLTNKSIPDRFFSYKSQTGGQAILYSSLQKISPFSHAINLQIFRAINSFLTALCFVLFLGWCYRNFGFISSFVTFLLLFISPWVNNFAHNLWWSLWCFYLPFLTMLLLLEKRHKQPESISEKKILLFVFLAMFVKCVFNGFEYITTTMLAIIVPVVYYYVLEKKSFLSFFVFSFKTGMCALFAVLAEMIILIIQLRALTGSFSVGVDHIVSSFFRRTTRETIAGDLPSFSYPEVIQKYLGNNAFDLGFANGLTIPFGLVILFVLLGCVVLYIALSKKKVEYRALAITVLFSLLCPLSWLIIFKQHATEHPHLDYIVWYIPFLLLGFLGMGVLFSTLVNAVIRKQ